MQKIASAILKSPLFILAGIVGLVFVVVGFIARPKEFIELVTEVKKSAVPPTLVQGAGSVNAKGSVIVIQGENSGNQVNNSAVQGGITQHTAPSNNTK